MNPIIICLICLGAIAVWILFLAVQGIESLLRATAKSVLWALGGLAGYGVLYLLLHLIMILGTDSSVLGDIIRETFGGVGVLIAFVVILGIIGAIVAFFGRIIFGVLLAIATAVCQYILLPLIAIFVGLYAYLEEKISQLFERVVNKLYRRIAES